MADTVPWLPGTGTVRRAVWLLIITLIYFPLANEGWQIRWERKVWGSSLTSPVITHSRLLSSPQTLLSNRTGHGQLWHMPEQRMHYLQVSSHSSSKTRWSKCALLFLLEGKWTGGKETPQRGGEGLLLMWMLLMSAWGHVTFTRDAVH